MVNPVTNSNDVNGLAVLQARFAISSIGGVIRVIDLDEVGRITSGIDDSTLSLYKREDAAVLMKRVLEEVSVATKPKDDIENFYIYPSTRVYRSTCFNPDPAKAGELNLWSDPPIKPVAGDWSVLKSHLVDVVCSSCPTKSDYLTKFLAHMLQKPAEKPGVMIVLKGGQGTGKGALLQIVQRIWQGTSLFTSNIDHVVGRFTGALERSYVVLLDEALFKGDKRAVDRMKSLITEPRCQIEEKNQPTRSLKSIHRFFATTNHDQFGHTDIDDRRHAFFDVSDSRQGDEAYFDELFAAINDDKVIAAMMHDLKNLDLTSFNVRVAPRTDDHGAQILKSLSGLDRYWYQVLTSAELPLLNGGFGATKDWTSDDIFVTTKGLHESYELYDRHNIRFERRTLQDVGAMIARLCPSAKYLRKTESGKQRRGYVLPDLDVARIEFEAALGVEVSWI
jgi:hypothetical protein